MMKPECRSQVAICELSFALNTSEMTMRSACTVKMLAKLVQACHSIHDEWVEVAICELQAALISTGTSTRIEILSNYAQSVPRK